MASSDSSSEEGSSAKVSKTKLETRRLTSTLAAAFASPQHVMTVPRITADATPPKPEPKLDLLAEVQNSEQQPSTSTATETEKDDDDDDVRESQRQQQETEKLPNLVIDRDDDDEDDEDGKDDVAGDAAARQAEEDANVA